MAIQVADQHPHRFLRCRFAVFFKRAASALVGGIAHGTNGGKGDRVGITDMGDASPAAFLAYYLTPKKCKNLTLLIVSLIFYSWGEVRYFPIMLSIAPLPLSRGVSLMERMAAKGTVLA